MQSVRRAELNTTSWKSRLAWMVLVVLIPFAVTVLMIGLALQLVGLPVWQTSSSLLGLTHKPLSVATGSSTEQLLLQERRKNSVLRSDKSALQRRLTEEQALEQELRNRIATLQGKLNARANQRMQAKQEAAVLLAMDADQAAQLLSKMQVAQAANVVAAMSASDAGPILSQLDPGFAKRVLTMAAQITAEATPATTRSGG